MCPSFAYRASVVCHTAFSNAGKESQPKLVGSAVEVKGPIVEMLLLCQVCCNSPVDSNNIISEF